MNRAVDGAASAAANPEREELARVLKADPLLRSEFEDLEAVHVATASLFRQLALPEDFSKRVMRRIQGVEVPADAEEDASDGLRLPSARPLQGRAASVVSQHRRRARVYAIVAFMSAAAALLLALGVITGAFSSKPEIESTQPNTAADGRQGVPDNENPKPHRDSHPQPLPKDGEAPKGDSLVTDKPGPDGGKIDPAPVPEKRPDDQVDKPEGSEPEQPVVPDEPGDEPEAPGEVVEDQPTPEKVEPGEPEPKEGATVAGPDERSELGHMLVLNGRVDLVGADGTLTRLADDQVIYTGDRIRTNVNAVVMLQLAGGDVTLGKDTEVSLDSDNTLRLEECDGKPKGLIAVDRNSGHNGSSFDILCGEYSLCLINGATVLERKRNGLDISKAVGFATLTHETLGSLVFPEDSGYEAEVDFGKEYDAPKAVSVLLPVWSADTRSRAVMLAIASPLNERTFASNRERAEVNRNLPGKLDKLMRYPTTTDSVIEFLINAIERDLLDGFILVKMTGEVENACAEVTELAPEVVCYHAGRAALVAENFEQWRDYFYRLMRPPVESKEPKNPKQPAQPGQPEPP